jgi:hypothetical protein
VFAVLVTLSRITSPDISLPVLDVYLRNLLISSIGMRKRKKRKMMPKKMMKSMMKREKEPVRMTREPKKTA